VVLEEPEPDDPVEDWFEPDWLPDWVELDELDELELLEDGPAAELDGGFWNCARLAG
jgi:hypothetical protein